MTQQPQPRMITLRLPLSHWQQIVNDIEDMCGVGQDDIEILSQVEHVDNRCMEPRGHVYHPLRKLADGPQQ